MTNAVLNETLDTKTVGGGDDVRQYLQDIRKFPRLTAQEELELAKRYASGDESAISRMVNCNLRLVVSVAREYAGRGVPLLDLIQEGSIGLLAAAKKFDYTREVRFSTYATKWIRQGVTRYLTEQGALIRVPAYTSERLRKVLGAKAALLQENGEEPTAAEIAAYCGMDADKVLQLLRLNPEVCSLDAPVGDTDSATMGAVLEDIRAQRPHEALVRKELKQTMEELLSMLTDRQQQVLRLHFGMDSRQAYSLEQISKQLGISKERVRQIEQQAMKRLQNLGAELGLEDFFE